MNFLCIKPEMQSNDYEVKLTDQGTLTHLSTILKKKPGALIKVKLLGKGVGEAVIKTLNSSELILEIVKFQKVKESGNISLAIGACRPLMAKRILEHGTTLGVKSFTFFNSFFSEKSYLDSKVLKKENAERYILKGLSQTRNNILVPEFSLKSSIQEVDLTRFSQKIYLDGPSDNFLNPKTPMDNRVVVFIGGERGWPESEVEFLKENKVTEVAVSESTLRVEFAMQAFMAQAEWVKNACP